MARSACIEVAINNIAARLQPDISLYSQCC